MPSFSNDLSRVPNHELFSQGEHAWPVAIAIIAALAVAVERLGLLAVSDRRGGEGAEQAEKKSKQTISHSSLNRHA